MDLANWEKTPTSRILSSSISLKTVPLIWFGFSATQLKTGIRNFVLMGFLILTATRETRGVSAASSSAVSVHTHKFTRVQVKRVDGYLGLVAHMDITLYTHNPSSSCSRFDRMLSSFKLNK